MKKVGKSSKKGFTLVELIVVLVILAILAAMLVPALVGYIDRAKKEKEFQAASTVYTAAQALATEAYGKGEPSAKAISDYAQDTSKIYALTGVEVKNVEVKMLGTADDSVDGFTIKQIKVTFPDDNVYYYSLTAKTWATDNYPDATSNNVTVEKETKTT